MIEKAIITGGAGLVGQSLARYLAKQNIDVLCLGRKQLSTEDIKKIFGNGISYLKLDLKNIDDLENKIEKLNWIPGNNCIFYHFAWSGVDRLTDGNIEDQLKNVAFSADAIKVAKKIGCLKFVNSGTIEETYADWHLIKKSKYNSSQANYAMAKLAARDMCKMVAYLEKINYIHTRLSVPLSPDLSKGGYVPQTLKKIISQDEYVAPENEQLFDIVSTEDASLAYYKIGLKGLNNSDYYIGYGKPIVLKDYFSQFENYIKGLPIIEKDYSDIFSSDFFKTDLLQKDTDFEPKFNQYNFFEK
tara:strand:- start:24075 stop:24977 length:903 start_codon:yes stop_codon:yes gene_type:complete